MHIYLLAVNALGLIIMHYDKYLAQNNKWRIPEKTLLGIAVIGGGVKISDGAVIEDGAMISE